MKLIIDIPEEAYNDIQSRDWKNGELIFSEEWKAIHNGTPIPDNATNEKAIRALFPYTIFVEDGIKNRIILSKEWWNSPYQKGGE